MGSRVICVFPAMELLCGLRQVLHLLLVSHSFPQKSNSGWSHQPRLFYSMLEIRAVGGTAKGGGASCDNSLPTTASCIHIQVINEIGSRGREAGLPQEGARAQLRWLRRGWRAAQESPSSVPPGKCSRVWTIANEALTCHRWRVDSSFSQTLGPFPREGLGSPAAVCLSR